MITNKKLVALLGLSCALVAAPAFSEGWSLGVSGVGVSTDSTREKDAGAEDGFGVEVDARKTFGQNSALQFSYSGWEIDIPIAGEKGIDALTLNYLYGRLHGQWQGYLLAGAGVSQAELPNGNDDSHAHLNAGIGGSVAVSQHWAIGSELKWRRSYDDASVAGVDEYDDWSLSLGLRYAFGGNAAAAESSHVAVASAGTTAKPMLKPVAKKPVAVKPKKAAPASAAGGCVGQQYTAYFASGSSTLSAQDRVGLRMALDGLKACSAATIVVHGYSAENADGGAAGDISKARANRVAAYLCGNGLDCVKQPVARMAEGATNPVHGSKPEDTELLSRRAEIWLKN